MPEFVLRGLDAANPLAFLAALGTLRMLGVAHGVDQVALRWQVCDGRLRPQVRVARADGDDVALPQAEAQFAQALHETLCEPAECEALAMADDLTLPLPAFRLWCEKAATRPSRSALGEFIAAFGSDAIEACDNGKPSGKMADTAFRTMSGAGHQHFLGFMRKLVDDMRPEHLERALFSPWRYDDPVESHTMRWDPVDDVRYALRARDSSGDPERKRGGSVWGANRLAIAALPLLPTMPVTTGRLGTTGFSQFEGEGAAWTWPVWKTWCCVDTVRSLLAMRALQQRIPPRASLAPMGVIEVFRCCRITQGKYRNFTPASPV